MKVLGKELQLLFGADSITNGLGGLGFYRVVKKVARTSLCEITRRMRLPIRRAK